MGRLVDRAINEALKSDHRQKIGAIIFDKSKIVSCGHNYSQKNVRSLLKKFQKWPGSVHAEVDAIIRARTDVKNMDIIVVRVNSQGELRLAKPCKYCMMYLDHVGIRRVYYSTGVSTEIMDLTL